VQVAHPAGDRQTEAGAAAGVVAGAEAVEDPLEPVGRDAGAIVTHVEAPRGVIDQSRGDDDLAVGRAVAHGVVEQVRDELGQARPVGRHREVRRQHVVTHASVASAHASLVHGIREKVRDPDLREVQRGDPGVDAREVEQVRDEGAEALGLLQRAAQGPVVRGDDPVDEVLEQGALGGEGGAQLVRHRGHELAALGVGGGQIRGHGVEGPRQLPDLVGGGCRDALSVVASRHAPRGRRHLAQR
jgi:hypothetical protein